MSTIILPATLPRTKLTFSVEDDDEQHADLAELELDDSQKSQSSVSSQGVTTPVRFRPDLSKTRSTTNLFMNMVKAFGSATAGSKPSPLEDEDNTSSTRPSDCIQESDSKESTKQIDSSNAPKPEKGPNVTDHVEGAPRNSSTNREVRGDSNEKLDRLQSRPSGGEGRRKPLKKSKSLSMDRSSQHGDSNEKRSSRRGLWSVSPPRRPLMARQSASRAILAAEVPGHNWVASSSSRPSRIHRTRSETDADKQKQSQVNSVRKCRSSRNMRELSKERKAQRERKSSLQTALQRTTSGDNNAAWEPRDSSKKRLRKQKSLRQSSARTILQRVDSMKEQKNQRQSSARNIMQRVDSIRQQQSQLRQGLAAQSRLSSQACSRSDSLSDSSVHDSDDEADNEIPRSSYSIQTYIETLAAMKKNVPCRDRSYRLKTYTDCFLGQDAVSFVQLYLKLESREEALQVGLDMNQKLHCWEHVCLDHPLKDEYLFYRFSDGRTTPTELPQKADDTLMRDVDIALGAGASFPTKEAHLNQEAIASIAALVGIVGDLKNEVMSLRQEVKELRSLVDK